MSVAQIAKAAGVSRRSVFDHFPKKELILFPNAVPFKEEFVSRLVDLSSSIALDKAVPVVMKIVLSEVISVQDDILQRRDVLKRYHSVRAAHAYFYHQIAEELCGCPEVSGPENVLARTTWGAFTGACAANMWAWQISDDAATPAEFYEVLIEMFRPQFQALDKVRGFTHSPERPAQASR